MVIVHFLVNSETTFPVKTFELPSFGFHETESRGEPGGGNRERNKSGLERSKGVKDTL